MQDKNSLVHKTNEIWVKKVNGRYGSDWEYKFYDRDGNNFQTLYRSTIYDYIKYLYDFFVLDERTIKLLCPGVVSILSHLKFEHGINLFLGEK